MLLAEVRCFDLREHLLMQLEPVLGSAVFTD